MRFFAAIGSLLLALLLAALIVPPFVDWDRFKSRFEAEASRALGQEVAVLGTASLRLLPLPSITFTNLRLGPENAVLLSARSFAMDVELVPLLSGDVVIADMRLDRPQLEVRLNENGSLIWPERSASRLNETPIAIERLAVSDGILRFRDARFEREIILQDIDFAANADEISGPWRGDGTLRWGEERLRMRLALGRLREDETFSLRANIEPQSLPFDVIFEGLGAFSADGPRADGVIRLANAAAPDGADRINFPRHIKAEALPFSVQADAQITADGVSVPAYELQLGAEENLYTITGEGSLNLGEVPSFQASAVGQQVSLERLEAAVGTAAAPENQDIAGRLELLRLFLVQVPRLPGDGEISLSLPAFVANDTVIRDIEAKITALGGSGNWRLKNARALLPGRTDLRADGVLSVGETIAYTGALTVASRQPTGFATWLGRAKPEDLAGISSAGFAANARLNADAIVLDELEIVLNDQSLTGRLERRNGLTDLSLQGETADLDKLQALAALMSADDQQTPISSLSLDVSEAIFDGVLAEGVRAQSSVSAGEIVLETLNIDNLRGSTITASARWPLGQGPLAGGGEMRIQADTLTGLFRLANERGLSANALARFANTPSLSANADLIFTYLRRNAAFDLTVDGSAGGVAMDATVEKGETLRLALTASNGATLFNLLGLPIVPGVDLGRGGLTVRADGNGSGAYNVSTTLTLRDGYASAAGTLEPVLEDGALILSGALASDIEVSSLDPFITLFGTPLPGFGQANAVRLSADIGLDRNAAVVQALAGQVGGTNVQGAFSVNGSAIDGNLTLDRADAQTLAAFVFEEGAVLSSLSGEIDLTVQTLDLTNTIPSATNATANANLDAGDVTLENVSANWLDGALSGQMTLARNASGPLISASGQLENAAIPQLATALGLPDVVEGRADISGRFETSGANGFAQNLTGTGSVAVREGGLAGLSRTTFSNVLTRADALEDDVLNERAADVVSAEVGEGRFGFGRTDFSYSITNGRVRADNIVLSTPTISARAGGRLNLADTNYETQLDAVFDAGLERVEGTAPGLRITVLGEAGEARRTVDATAFTTYLAARLAEKRERQFLAQRAGILERQRLRRTARLYQLKEEARRFAREEQERIERLRREEAEARRLEAEQRRREAQERQRLDEELRLGETGTPARRQEELDLLNRQRERDWDARNLQTPLPLLDFEQQFGTGD